MSINDDVSKRLNSVIPGGAHTYSRGDDQFPSNAPPAIRSGKGSLVLGTDNKTYLDFGMALRSVILGYSNREVNEAAIGAINLGNGFTRASMLELEAAELFVNAVPNVDMVKFCKNGSNATSAAVKLARAYTGKDYIVRCKNHPFFSFDDWFIGDTPITRGIPYSAKELTLNFVYNDIASLESIFVEFADKIACVIMEPAAVECPFVSEKSNSCCGQYPCDRQTKSGNFLKTVQEICRRNNSLFILDETITGFRWSLKGAQDVFGVQPDLSTFGKAMANGFSVAALAGKREIMELGSIKSDGAERTFLLSSTHGAEMSSLAAFMATYEFIKENHVIEHIWKTGAILIKEFNDISSSYDMRDIVYLDGPSCNPFLQIVNENGEPDFVLRTLYQELMIEYGILMPWISLSYSHTNDHIDKLLLCHSEILKKFASTNYIMKRKEVLINFIKPVFRKYN